MTQIAILDDYQNVAKSIVDWERLPKNASLTVFNDHVFDQKMLVDRLKNFEIICAMRERTPFPRSVLEQLPKLKLLITTGMRNASIDVTAARELGIDVCGTGSVPYPTAELTWALVLDLARNVSVENEAVKSGFWQTKMGVGLKGKTLGLIGLGNLGSQVARYGNAFGMNVIAWSQNLTQEKASENFADLVSLDTLMSSSDFVSIHTILSKRTKGLINLEKLKLMKRSAYLINTSRGPIVDENALIEVLNQGYIAGAGLDVFDSEPMGMKHPLILSERTTITPHIGYVTQETYEVFFEDTLECVLSYINGTLVRLIN